MPMPFKVFTWNIRILLKSIYNACNASRQRNFCIRHSIAHRIARTDFYRDPSLYRKLMKFIYKRNNKTVKVRSCDIFKMTARNNSCIKSIGNRCKIMFKCLTPGHFQLLKYMVIRTAYQYTRLFYSHITHKLEIFTACPYPCRDLGKFKP